MTGKYKPVTGHYDIHDCMPCGGSLVGSNESAVNMPSLIAIQENRLQR